MLGDIGTLRQGEAQAGSDKEYMETGEHIFRSVNENLIGYGPIYQEKRGVGLPLLLTRRQSQLEHLHQAALRFRCCDKKESYNSRSIAD